MKVAVVGKGGAGKTTTSSVVARVLARGGASVVALDGDTNPNLGLSLGVGFDETERLVGMRQALDADEGDGDDHAADWDDLLDRFASTGPDGVQFAVVSQIDNPDPGCP
ncbi:MAG: AAA family ATPase [Acidimicrobiales bacterium]|nr:AAA family ATPase [Acidimicrobiales bacterium]